MKKTLYGLIVFVLLANFSFKALAKPIKVFTSIAPIEFLIEQTGANLLEAESLLLPGQNPTNFQPKISQITRLNQATIYFSTGLPFEKIIVKKLKASNESIKIVNLQESVDLRYFAVEHEHHGDHCHGHSHDSHQADPHIWLSPKNGLKISQTIQKELRLFLPEKKDQIEKNAAKIQTQLKQLDRDIQKTLAPFKNALFFVYHPAFGYFADAYQLKQVAVETNGKSPTPKNLKKLMHLASENHVQTIFIQEQFNSRSAKILAKSINAKVSKIDPLAKDYITNLELIANTIAEGLIQK